MKEIIGTSPQGNVERIVEIHRDGATVSIWVHKPGSDDTSGWQAIVSIDKLREALAEEGISN